MVACGAVIRPCANKFAAVAAPAALAKNAAIKTTTDSPGSQKIPITGPKIFPKISTKPVNCKNCTIT